MRRFVEIFRAGQTSVLIDPVRSVATFTVLLVMLVPFLVGIGISDGLRLEESAAINSGGDLYVSGSRFGQSSPLPASMAEELMTIDGVLGVVPRIIGLTKIGRDHVAAVIVGLPEAAFPDAVRCVSGRLPGNAAQHELVVGTALAKHLKVTIGSQLPPFYRNPEGERTSVIVGMFESRIPFWQSQMMLTTVESAQRIFAQPDSVTDFVVYCRQGYSESVRVEIQRTVRDSAARDTLTQLNVRSRESLSEQILSDRFQKLGIFTLQFVVAFVCGLLVILVTSGYGQTERRREIGILKATGWQTDEVLLKAFVECLLISVTAAATSIAIAFLWLRVLDGAGIVGFFISGVDVFPGFPVPFRLLPVPAMVAFVVALSITLSGSLYTSWQYAIVPPDEAMR